MVRIIEEEGTRFTDPDSFEAQVAEYAQCKGTIEVMEARAKDLREKLFDVIETQGFEDDKGNIVLELDAPIAGITRLEKQRRVTRKLDESIAEGILEQAGITDEVYKTIRVIDEDALMAAHYEGKLTEDEIDQMFPSKIVWALQAPKKK